VAKRVSNSRGIREAKEGNRKERSWDKLVIHVKTRGEKPKPRNRDAVGTPQGN